MYRLDPAKPKNPYPPQFWDLNLFKDLGPTKTRQIILSELHVMYLREDLTDPSDQWVPAGLDDLNRASFKSDDYLNFVWRAKASFRDPIWLSENGRQTLRGSLDCSDRELDAAIKKGRLEVLVSGKLAVPPQFMNSFGVPLGLCIVGSPWKPTGEYKQPNRYYAVRSLHVETFDRSHRFLDQYRMQHFITKVCESHGAIAPKKYHKRTIPWLQSEYRLQWSAFLEKNPAFRQRYPPPSKTAILPHLAVHMNNLEYWWKHALSILPPVALEGLRSYEYDMPWLPVPIQDSDNDDNDDYDDSAALPDHFSAQIPHTKPNHGDTSFRNDLKQRTQPSSASKPKSPILTRSLVWKCSYPSERSSFNRCRFVISLLDLTPDVLESLNFEQVEYLTKGDWDAHDRKLYECFLKMVDHHYRTKHSTEQIDKGD